VNSLKAEKHEMNYFRFWTGNASWLSNPAKDSLLRSSGIELSFMNNDGRVAGVCLDILSLKTHSYGENEKARKHLSTVLDALMPLILDYRTCLIEFDTLCKSPLDRDSRKASGDMAYRASYLISVIDEAFETIKDMPTKEMNATALGLRHLTKERVQQLIKRSPFFLRYIACFQAEHLTYELCFDAVKAEGAALAYVPGQFIDHKLCMAACSSNGGLGFEHVPQALRTNEVIERALLSNGGNLRLLHHTERTYERCLLAMLKDAFRAYDHVPYVHRTVAIEYVKALHGASELSAGWIYAQAATAEPTLRTDLDAIYDRFVAMHYANTPDADLEDLGHARRPVAL
jgi:DNA-dependent RNA polymerase auxiliary subunit epsilon